MYKVLLSSRSLCLSLWLSVLASLAWSTLWLSLLSSLSLSVSSLLVGLLYLTLLDTLGDSGAAGIQDSLYRVLSIVVSRDNEVDIVRIRVGINDSEYGDTQTVSLANGNVLLHYVYNEECAWQTGQISDRTKVLLKLSTLTSDLQQLAL